MLTYSIAIRTLGLGGDIFRRELESITRQTVQPERVVVYIAEGYERPAFTVGREEYVWVKKGMVAQRVLPYDDITSDCILMLDDDVELSPYSAERLLTEMEQTGADCMGADIFKNHEMPLRSKVMAMASNLVFPHHSQRWAFRIRRCGSFSYINRPVKACYPSQSCGGPVMLWRKASFLRLRMEDEMWLETLGFCFGDDGVESYKVHQNGGRLYVSFDAGITNLDASTSSGAYRRSADRMRLRTKAMLIMWWRTEYCLDGRSAWQKAYTALCFTMKMVWMAVVMVGAAIVKCSPAYISQFFAGLRDGWRFVHTPAFRAIPNYIVPDAFGKGE